MSYEIKHHPPKEVLGKTLKTAKLSQQYLLQKFMEFANRTERPALTAILVVIGAFKIFRRHCFFAGIVIIDLSVLFIKT